MTEGGFVRVERADDGIVTVTLDEARTKNGISRQGWRDLFEAFDDISRRPGDRVVILTGAGGTFCSGARIDGERDPDDSPQHGMRLVNAALFAIRDLPQPTIAAVAGYAVGAGFNLALACDLVIAEESARFSQIFAKRGLTVDFGGTWLLPHMVGLHKAKEIAFFARLMSAGDVHDLGLLNKVVSDGLALTEAESWARELLGIPPMALSNIKALINLGSQSTIEDSAKREAVTQHFLVTTEDTREAMRAFFERRDGTFENR